MDGRLRFCIASCDKPTSVFADARETFTRSNVVENVVAHEAMAKEIGEGPEVVETVKTKDNVCVWVMCSELSAK